MAIRAAVDIGGTFTDLALFNEESGELRVDKTSSRAEDPIAAVLEVVAKAGVEPRSVEQFIHGTTVVTNALLQRRGARVAFVTNRGFRDTIFVRDANRRDLYSMTWRKPRPLVNRVDCLEVDCRVDSTGVVERELSETDVLALIAALDREGIRAVAICFLFSYLNPVHELELAGRLRAALPDVSISLSHDVYARWREAERAGATIADAFVLRMFADYANNLQTGLAGAGSPARLLVMKSNGGVAAGDIAAQHPTNYLVSGPVGGALAGSHFASLAGFERVITMDIGGTSCDVALVEDARPTWSTGLELDFGLTIRAPMLDIRTIGAGGGSIAWIDDGGLLHVGPVSAGADPGPACYDRGGSDPTLTDANLVLGRLDAGRFCGGEMPLSTARAQAAVHAVAAALAMSDAQAALAIARVAGDAIANALRAISVERGIDPREFALVAFGGAGGLHACEVAREIGIPTVLIPPFPGNVSAIGLLIAGLRSDAAATLLVRSDAAELVEKVNAALGPLRQRASEGLRDESGVSVGDLVQHLELRYYGQNYHREIPITATFPLSSADIAAALAAFRDDYELYYGYRQDSELIEVVGASVAAVAERPKPALGAPYASIPSSASPLTREVCFPGAGWSTTPIVRREDCAPGDTFVGPAIVDEDLSTTVVPPGSTLTVLASGTMQIAVGGEP